MRSAIGGLMVVDFGAEEGRVGLLRLSSTTLQWPWRLKQPITNKHITSASTYIEH